MIGDDFGVDVERFREIGANARGCDRVAGDDISGYHDGGPGRGEHLLLYEHRRSLGNASDNAADDTSGDTARHPTGDAVERANIELSQIAADAYPARRIDHQDGFLSLVAEHRGDNGAIADSQGDFPGNCFGRRRDFNFKVARCQSSQAEPAAGVCDGMVELSAWDRSHPNAGALHGCSRLVGHHDGDFGASIVRAAIMLHFNPDAARARSGIPTAYSFPNLDHDT